MVSLFTSIPTDLALRIVKERLELDEELWERTTVSVINVMRLLTFVLNNNFFTHNGIYYQQIFGCPMGSPVSAILANLVMEHVEEIALSSAVHPPKWWYRYVDDSHVCLHRDYVEEFHTHLNAINPHIQFTFERECDKSLSFLDTITTRQQNGHIEVSVYRKPTHTDKYLDFKSSHPPQHKRSVARTLFNRAINIPTSSESRSNEIQHIFDTLSTNGYPKPFLQSCLNQSSQPIINREENGTGAPNNVENERQPLIILPYVQGMSERISNVLKRHNITVAHKPVKTLSSVFRKPKDKLDRDCTTCVVYKVNCKDCDAVYIGQTSRSLKTRIREHSHAIAKSDKNSLLVQHHLQTKHNIDLDDVKIIDRCDKWSQRLILEAWHSMREPTSINERIILPSVFNSIVNS